MPELDVRVVSAAPVPYSLTPILAFRLGITEAGGGRVESIALRCQILVEAARRAYADREQEALLDLFGERSRWGRTMRTMLWTHAATVVPPFRGETEVDLPVACTFDLSVSAGKYFFALDEGDVPLTLQFSGSIFWRDGDDGALSVAPIPWSQEAAFRLPVATWRAMMDEHYPGTAWVCLGRDVADELLRFKSRRGLRDWDEAVAWLLGYAGAPAATGGGHG